MHFALPFAILSAMKTQPSPRPSPARRASSRAARAFGDLCERTDGLASVWRGRGCTEREMLAFERDDPSVLCDVVPALHALGFSEDDVVRHLPHDGVLASLALGLSRLVLSGGRRTRGSAALAVPPYVLAAFLRRALTRRMAALRNRAARGAHYAAEKARRRAMAAERRRVKRRATESPCPTAEEILEAWRHARDSKEALVRFGSMMQDLECYVDNSLRMDGRGRIVGRSSGVKGWLRERLPELAARYSSVMRYKAAAKKLRQIVGLSDPTPVAAVLGEEAARAPEGEAARAPEDGAEAARAPEGEASGDGCDHGAEKSHGAGPTVEVVRARAVYLEVMEGVPDVAARVMARIDALCDPERADEAATLRGWREKYGREITVRRKDSWWRRLIA